jgi:hypothetical protein
MDEIIDNRDSMEKMSDVLNTTFEQDVTTVDKQLDVIKQKKLLVSKKEAEGMLVLDDQEEIKNGLRSVISNLEMVMEKLQQDIKIGSKVFSHQVYSQCATVLVESYRELAEINKNIFDCRIKLQQASKKEEGVKGIKENTTIPMTAQQLSDMLENARKNSSINAIDASFKVVE